MVTKTSPKAMPVKTAKRKTASSSKKSTREKLLKDLGRRLILSEDYVTGQSPSTPDGTEYGVVIYYNGSIKPNV
jgi:hypothetical protein